MRPKFLWTPRAPFLLGVMCLLLLAGCGKSSSSGTAGTPAAANNTATVMANFGPDGEAGGIVNGFFTTVTVCQHATSNCAAINNVLVDTGSIGLRLTQGVLGSVTLSPILENGSALEECLQYGDTSYSWGPMELADVQIAGEKAANIPVQLLGATTAAVPGNCLRMPVNSTLPGNPPGNEDTVTSLGANGILGIGGDIVDCGAACTTVSFTSGYPYYTCPGGTCAAVAVPTSDQAANPVAAFISSDKNGVMITLPSVSATGAVSVSGTMNFGIGTQSNNALGNATLFAMDACGDFPTATFNGVAYSDTACTSASGSGSLGAFLDTGSNALFVLDHGTLTQFGISDCAQNTNGFGFYCGTATLSNIGLVGNGNVGSGTISLSIADATALFTTNHAVFSNLGGDSVTTSPGPSTDFFDLGLPFFLGRTVFVGIAGEAVPNGANAPNGFVAF